MSSGILITNPYHIHLNFYLWFLQNSQYCLKGVTIFKSLFHFQIVAVILCDTGIALLAYMDGITGSPTLGGVVLAASAAACSAVYKVRLP